LAMGSILRNVLAIPRSVSVIFCGSISRRFADAHFERSTFFSSRCPYGELHAIDFRR
jgi:hypothetical protein